MVAVAGRRWLAGGGVVVVWTLLCWLGEEESAISILPSDERETARPNESEQVNFNINEG